MGRLAKNPVISEVFSEAVTVPVGSSLNRPAAPRVGSLRFNVTNNKLEYWNSTEWRIIGTEGYAQTSMDVFTANGIDSAFGPASVVLDPGQERNVLIFIDSVYQIPGEAYSFNGTTTINFTSVPPFGSTIVVLAGFNSTIM